MLHVCIGSKLGIPHMWWQPPQKKTTIRVYLKIGHPKTFMIYSSSLKFEFGFSPILRQARSMPAGWIQACCKHIGHTVFVTWVMKKGNRVEWKQLGTVHLLKGPQRNVNKPKSRTTTSINSNMQGQYQFEVFRSRLYKPFKVCQTTWSAKRTQSVLAFWLSNFGNYLKDLLHYTCKQEAVNGLEGMKGHLVAAAPGRCLSAAHCLCCGMCFKLSTPRLDDEHALW